MCALKVRPGGEHAMKRKKREQKRWPSEKERERNEDLVGVDVRTQQTDHSTYTIEGNPAPLPTNIDPWGNPNT